MCIILSGFHQSKHKRASVLQYPLNRSLTPLVKDLHVIHKKSMEEECVAGPLDALNLLRNNQLNLSVRWIVNAICVISIVQQISWSEYPYQHGGEYPAYTIIGRERNYHLGAQW
jgi:hypothetical protein